MLLGLYAVQNDPSASRCLFIFGNMHFTEKIEAEIILYNLMIQLSIGFFGFRGELVFPLLL